MDDFRYGQFCPLARAAEILGHRWVLVILRELAVGPQRFSDLRRRLPGVSTSVLAGRLTGLEEHGVVARRELGPPAPATVYELTPDGRALEPALIELTRWGARFLAGSQPTDHVEPDWLNLGLRAFAVRGPTPARRFELCPFEGEREAVLRFEGGLEGTREIDDDGPVDARLRGPVKLVMALVSGALPVATVLANENVQASGNIEALSELPALFQATLESNN